LSDLANTSFLQVDQISAFCRRSLVLLIGFPIGNLNFFLRNDQKKQATFGIIVQTSHNKAIELRKDERKKNAKAKKNLFSPVQTSTKSFSLRFFLALVEDLFVSINIASRYGDR
jgi:hypothetical protein